MTIQQLIEELEKYSDKTQSVWILCYSPYSQLTWAFYELASVQRNRGGRAVLSIPGGRLPESPEGAKA